jgi:hypothetical protein
VTRAALTEHLRRLQVEARRDPVEAAIRAFEALSNDEKQRMVAEYNERQSLRAHPARLTWQTEA